MKIDVGTVNVLKNFAKINSSIVVKEGNVLKTISPLKAIMAKATVNTYFEKPFAIYSLDRFLSILSLFNDPELDFGESSVTIHDDSRSTVYVYADDSTIIQPSNKKIVLPSVDVEFTLLNDNLKSVEKAAAILQLPEIVVVGDGESVSLQAADTKTPSSDTFSIRLGSSESTFKAVFKSENMKIIPDDYRVAISSQGLSYFKSDVVEYWIAVEQHSSF